MENIYLEFLWEKSLVNNFFFLNEKFSEKLIFFLIFDKKSFSCFWFFEVKLCLMWGGLIGCFFCEVTRDSKFSRVLLLVTLNLNKKSKVSQANKQKFKRFYPNIYSIQVHWPISWWTNDYKIIIKRSSNKSNQKKKIFF
jgi:hypothetical protein